MTKKQSMEFIKLEIEVGRDNRVEHGKVPLKHMYNLESFLSKP